MTMAAFNTMSAIKKKMHGMKSLKDTCNDDVDQIEQKLVVFKAIHEKQEEATIQLMKRTVQIQADLVVVQQNAQEANVKLDEKTELLTAAENEMTGLGKSVRTLEEEFETTETKLLQTTTKLEEANKSFEESDRGRKVFESRLANDEEKMLVLEKELETAILFGEDSDRKYEETARKLAMTEVDLERSEGRVKLAEAKAIELEDELKVVGNNFKSLEIVQQEFHARQDSYEMTIQSLTESLEDAENRATQAEEAVSMLQKEIDRLEDELVGEKDKFRLVLGELDSTIIELTGF